jgi:hypothetical protein
VEAEMVSMTLLKGNSELLEVEVKGKFGAQERGKYTVWVKEMLVFSGPLCSLKKI